jgi:hypothetical protein
MNPGDTARQIGLPEWALLTLAVAFLIGSGFYLYRLLFPARMRTAYGYADPENEVGHGACMLAMVTMLAPDLLPVPSGIWAAALGGGAIWFFARALTWGKRFPGTRWWWDWAHVGMLAGMAAMFTGADLRRLTPIVAAFWLWFALYYAGATYRDSRAGRPLHLGSDVSHMSMGAVMLAMTVAPGLFMSHPGM